MTPDGARVYAAGFHTGNRTTSSPSFVGRTVRTAAAPGTPTSEGSPAPEVGLIVKCNGTHWVDELGRPLGPDHPVLACPTRTCSCIDASANPPAARRGRAGFFQGVGTILFNMAVNPREREGLRRQHRGAQQRTASRARASSPGTACAATSHESRITVLDAGRPVAPRHLNKHIDYATLLRARPQRRERAEPRLSHRDGGDPRTARRSTSPRSARARSASTPPPSSRTTRSCPSSPTRSPVSGGGPTGLVLDESAHQLYVLTRFDNAISIVDTQTRREIGARRACTTPSRRAS